MRSPHIRRKISADGNSKNPARSEDTDTRASTSVKTENIFMDFTTACKGLREKLGGVIATTVNSGGALVYWSRGVHAIGCTAPAGTKGLKLCREQCD